MDERGRVPLPPKYRDAFRDGVVLSQGSPDKCLRLYTQQAFDKQASEVTRESALQRRGKHLRWAFFSRSHATEFDKQNRILIPSAFREYADLSGTVLVIGTGECLEIWSPREYEAQMARVDEQLETTLESIEPRER
jgi:MraZ protein